MPSDFRQKVHDLLADYLERLDRLEKLEMVALAKEWDRLSETLKRLIDELSQKVNLTEDQLFRLELYKKFREEAALASLRYAQTSADIISAAQREFAELGLESADRMLSLSAKFYTKLPPEAITRMIGFTSDGSPLLDVLRKHYAENVENMVNILRDSMALGRNPLETAKLMGETIDGNVWKALQIARTEQLSVLREVQTDAYIASGICSGKDWLGEPDACEEICKPGIEENPYPLEALMDTHPNCRCAWSPVVG